MIKIERKNNYSGAKWDKIKKNKLQITEKDVKIENGKHEDI